MKKCLSAALSILLLLACLSTVVSAEEITPSGGKSTGDVVISIDKATVVYNVNVTWGNLVWNYAQGTWSVSDHAYYGFGLYTGTDTPAQTVTSSLSVENDSNAEVKVTVAFKDTNGAITASNGGITASLSSATIAAFDGTFVLESAEDYMNSADGDKEDIILTVTVGQRPTGEQVVVGTIVVTINKVSADT